MCSHISLIFWGGNYKNSMNKAVLKAAMKFVCFEGYEEKREVLSLRH